MPNNRRSVSFCLGVIVYALSDQIFFLHYSKYLLFNFNKTEKSCIYCTLVLIIKSISTFKCKILLLYGNKQILTSRVEF